VVRSDRLAKLEATSRQQAEEATASEAAKPDDERGLPSSARDRSPAESRSSGSARELPAIRAEDLVMAEWLTPYAATVVAIGATSSFLLIQILVADFAGIRARHERGTPISADHDDFLFRASRAHADTNERASPCSCFSRCPASSPPRRPAGSVRWRGASP
jgi:hypothetical protein